MKFGKKERRRRKKIKNKFIYWHISMSHKNTKERDDNASATNNNLLREINFFNDARFLHKNDKWVNNNIF